MTHIFIYRLQNIDTAIGSLPPARYGVTMYNFDPSTNEPRTRKTFGCLDNAIKVVSR